MMARALRLTRIVAVRSIMNSRRAPPPAREVLVVLMRTAWSHFSGLSDTKFWTKEPERKGEAKREAMVVGKEGIQSRYFALVSERNVEVRERQRMGAPCWSWWPSDRASSLSIIHRRVLVARVVHSRLLLLHPSANK